jgi:hypothetical protein
MQSCTEPVDTTPPLVVISSPKAEDVVARKASVPVTVTAGDDSGTVAEVLVFVNHTSICRMASPPFRCVWEVPPPPNRTYALQASARDAAGNVALSSIVQVKSENPPSREPEHTPTPEEPLEMRREMRPDPWHPKWQW